MVIITKTTIEKFALKYPIAAEPLNEWYKLCKMADWRNLSEMKKSFNSVDFVGNDRYCFNIKGNHFRLIALTIFKTRTIFILWFGTHVDYDKLNNSIGAANVVYK